jgi:hypothetical protein
MDDSEKLRLDYEQVHEYWRALAENRFKLLAIVPTLAGIGATIVGGSLSPGAAVVLGLLGFFATLGVTFYDQRNTQFYNDAMLRAKWLERQLGFLSLKTGQPPGGIFHDRPPRSLKLFGTFLMWHDRGLSFIYSSALATWVYVTVRGVTSLVRLPIERLDIWTVVVTILVGLAFFCTLTAQDEDVDAKFRNLI